MTSLPETPAPLPARIGPYRVERQLGGGSTGEVFAVRDPAGGPLLALKRLRNIDPEALLFFKEEFRSPAALVHDNLSRLYQLESVDGTWFFTMELVDGIDLDAHFSRVDTVMDRVTCLRDVLPQLVDGLEALHDRGLSHFDLKPSNVMVTATGRVVLVDFGFAGLSQALRSTATPDHIFGTPAFMAPEQMHGAAPAPSADIYALGLIIYNVLVGRLPFEADWFQMLKWKSALPVLHDLPPEVPADLRHVMLALLDPDPIQRPHARAIRGLLGNPDAAPQSMRSPLVGRHAVLSSLLGTITARPDLGTSLVSIHGVSGVGKSAVMREVASRLRARHGYTVLEGRCHEFQNIPFKGLDAVVDQAYLKATELEGEPRRTLHDASISVAAQMFPVLAGLVQRQPELPERPDADLQALAHAGIARVLAAIATLGPLCIVIDDAQWADLESARLLEYLLAPSASSSLRVVLVYRTDEARDSPFLAHLSTTHLSLSRPVFELMPLEAHDAAAMAARQLGAPFGNDIAERIARESRGNPFFIEQLAMFVRSSDQNAALDSTLQRVVQARIDTLTDDGKTLLRLASLAGVPLPQVLLFEAAQLTAPQRALMLLSRQSMVRTEGIGDASMVHVYHDRIRESVVELIDTETRRHLHGHLADAMDGHAEIAPDLLATHFHGAGELTRAATHAERAADLAARSLAFDRSAAHFANALSWGSAEPNVTQRRRLGLADALHRAGRCHEAAPAYIAAATHAEDSEERQRLEGRAVEAYLSAGNVEPAFSLLRPLMERAGIPFPGSPLAAVASIVGLVARLRWHIPRRGPLRSPSQVGHTKRRANLCWRVGKGVVNIAPAEGTATVLRGLLYAIEAGDVESAVCGLSFAGSGYPPFLKDRGEDLLDRAEGLAAQTDEPYYEGAVLMGRAIRCLTTGDWDRGVRLGDAAIETFERGTIAASWEISITRTLVTACLEYRGRMNEMAARSQDFLNAVKNRGDKMTFVMVSSALGYAHAASNDLDALQNVLRSLRHTMDAWSVPFGLWDFYELRLRVLLALRQDDADTALELVREHWPRIQQAGLLEMPVSRPAILQLRGAVEITQLAHRGWNDGKLRKSLKQTQRMLDRTSRNDAVGFSLVLRAALDLSSGRRRRGLHRLRNASDEYRKHQLEVCALMTERAVALATDALAQARAAERQLTALGINEPVGWARFHTPGL